MPVTIEPQPIPVLDSLRARLLAVQERVTCDIADCTDSQADVEAAWKYVSCDRDKVRLSNAKLTLEGIQAWLEFLARTIQED